MKTMPFLLLAMLATPVCAIETDASALQRFEDLYKAEWTFRLAEFPVLATSVGVHDYDDRLAHVRESDQQRRRQYWQKTLTQLNEIPCASLGRNECINYRIFKRQLEGFIADVESRYYLMPFNSDSGFYTSWTRLPEETEFTRVKDYDNYLARLAMLPEIMDEYIILMREGIRTGMTQPRVVLEGRDIAIRAQLAESPAKSTFFSPFAKRPEYIPELQWQSLKERANQRIAGVIAAYSKLLEFFNGEYVPGARTTLGAQQLPGGEAFYQAQIKHYATVSMSAAEIHQLGQQEVARIHEEMEDIIDLLEFKGSFADFIQFLRTDPQFYATSPRQLLAEASYWAKKMDGRLPALFGYLPRQPYGVEPVPADLAPYYTTGRYNGAPLDATRGGYYWVNTHALESRPLYALPALTLHEAVPGHHLQIAISKELEEQPPFRRYDYISAFGEGWGLYSEKLGVEAEIYETPYQNFGRLTYEMWRACRLVIDTGVHAMGWSREQAVDFLASNTALALHNVNTEVDRYISWPAQALSYKLGELTLWKLRREAEAALGADFDVREYHDLVLGLGSVPLDVLSDEVHYWLQGKKGDVLRQL